MIYVHINAVSWLWSRFLCIVVQLCAIDWPCFSLFLWISTLADPVSFPVSVLCRLPSLLMYLFLLVDAINQLNDLRLILDLFFLCDLDHSMSALFHFYFLPWDLFLISWFAFRFHFQLQVIVRKRKVFKGWWRPIKFKWVVCWVHICHFYVIWLQCTLYFSF